MDELRYPIGRFGYDARDDGSRRSEWIDEIEATPGRLRAAVRGLSDQQLDTPYRPDGWSVRKLVHHLPDSHLNAYVRFKLALTEAEPTIKGYDEAAWAELVDSRSTPVEVSLRLLEALHQRWVALLRGLTPADFERGFVHPEMRRSLRLREVLALYAWHGRHHVAHVERLRDREGWR